MAGSMLGAKDNTPAPMEINIVQQFLMQREEPKPLFTEMSVKEKDSQAAKLAAGYNSNLFFDRNWREASLGLAVYIKEWICLRDVFVNVVVIIAAESFLNGA